MTPEERRAQLAAELDTLLDAVVSIGPHSQRDADAGAPEGAFLAELERQLNEKTAELEALNARMNTFSYRFRATSRSLLWLVWLAAAGMLVFPLPLSLALDTRPSFCPSPWPVSRGPCGPASRPRYSPSAAPFRGRRFRLCPCLSVSHSGLAPRP